MSSGKRSQAVSLVQKSVHILIHIFQRQLVIMAFLIILYFTAVDLIDYLVNASKSHYLAFAQTNFRRARIFFLKILRIVPSFILILNHVRLS